MRLVKQVPDQLRSGDGEDERAKLCLMYRSCDPEPFCAAGTPEPTVRSAVRQPHHQPKLGLPSHVGRRPGPSRNLCKAHPDSAWVWMPGTSLMESGWSHSSGMARSPHYSPVAVPGSVCTTESRHRHC